TRRRSVWLKRIMVTSLPHRGRDTWGGEGLGGHPQLLDAECPGDGDERPKRRTATASASQSRQKGGRGDSHGGPELKCAESAHASRWIGSVNVNVEPFPSWLFTQIRPPCNSMSLRARASPSPVPSTFLSAVPT